MLKKINKLQQSPIKSILFYFVILICTNLFYPKEILSQERSWENYFHSEHITTITSKDDYIYVGLLRNGIVRYNKKTSEKVFYNNITTNLPLGWVSSISFDSSGTLWVTGGGLFKYKNEIWTMYTPENSQLPTDQIYSSFIDSSQNIWLATYGYGLLKFDGINWTSYNTTNSKIPSNNIWKIISDKKGFLWIATSNGLSKFDGKSFIVFNSSNSPIKSNEIICIGFDSKDDLWVSTNYSNGDNLFRYSNGVWYNYPYSQVNISTIYSMAFKNNGEIWLGGWEGLFKFDGIKWKDFNEKNSSIPSRYVKTMHIDKDQKLWLGSENFSDGNNYRSGGVSYYNGIDFIKLNLSNSSLPENDIYTVSVDSKNNAWFTSTSKHLIQFSSNGSKTIDIPSIGINACSTIDFDDNIWIGTYLDGIKIYTGQSWTLLNTSNSPITYNDVTDIVTDNKGQVWTVNGKDIIRLNSGKRQKFNSSNSNIPDDWARVISTDHFGNIWAIVGRSLVKYDGNIWHKTELPNNAQEINTLAVDSTLNIWLGTEYSGIFKFNGKTWIEYNIYNSPLQGNQVKIIKVNKDNVIWVGTTNNFGSGSGGVARIENGNWETFTFKNSKITFGDVSDIAFADSGKVWIATSDAGVSLLHDKINPDTLKYNNPVPLKFNLFPNYPNPFNNSTTINYQIAVESHVKISIYNILGQNIFIIKDKVQSPGNYFVRWEPINTTSNIYFCVLETDNYKQTIKLILLK